MNTIFAIERNPDYLAWLAEVKKSKPHAGRRLLLAREIGGTLHHGVRLSDGEEFFAPVAEGNLLAMIDAAAEIGATMRYTSKPRPEGHTGMWFGMDMHVTKTKPAWEAFRAQHASANLLVEVCASHVGGFVQVKDVTTGDVCAIDEH